MRALERGGKRLPPRLISPFHSKISRGIRRKKDEICDGLYDFATTAKDRRGNNIS